MSEEKLYAVKNDDGMLLLYSEQGAPLWRVWGNMFADKSAAERAANTENGRVVTLIEEPKKVVLTKEQAEIVEKAKMNRFPASYVAQHTGYSGCLEKQLMDAFVNGYTVSKEKKYNVKVPHAEGWHFQKYSSASKLGARNNWRPFPAKDVDSNMSKELFQFTEAEIEHYGLQDCEKEEVTDDAD